MISKENKYLELKEIYLLILENINDLICIVDPNYGFKFQFINEIAYLNILGYSRKDLIGHSILDFLHPDDVKNTVKILKKGTKIGERLQELRFKAKNGKYFWFEIKAKKFEENSQKRNILILRDISERKNLEQKFKETEEKFKELTNSIPEIRFWKLFYPKKYEEALKSSYDILQRVMDNIPENIFWKDTNLVYLGCNNNYANLIGAENPENVLGKTDKDFFLDIEKVKEMNKRENQVLKSGIAKYHVIEPRVLNDGTEIWLDINRIPLHDSEGKIVGILVTYEDITKRRIAEQMLKESEDIFRTLTEQSFMGIAIIQDDLMKYHNQRFADISEYTAEDIKNWQPREILKFIHPYDKAIVAEHMKKKQSGLKDAINYYQVRGIKKSGEIIWLEIFSKTIPYRGRFADFIMLIDITENKDAEDKLRESEKKYRHLFESSPNMICLVDVNKKIIGFNTAFLEFSGNEKEDLVGKDIFELKNFTPESRDIIAEKNKELLKKGYIRPIELELYGKNGNSIWVSLQASFVETGIKTLIEIIMRDVSDRKLSEDLLQVNKARVEALLKLSQMRDVSENEIFNFVCKKGVELTQSSIGCLLLMNEDESALRFNSCSNQSNIHCTFKNKQTFYLKETSLWKEVLLTQKSVIVNNYTGLEKFLTCDLKTDGKILRYMSIPILDGDKINAIVCVLNKESDYNEIDVHQLTLFMEDVWIYLQQKRAREALLESEKKYRDLLETSSMGILEFDLINKNLTYINPKLLEILGYENDVNLDEEMFTKIIHAEDIKKFYDSNNIKELELRVFDQTGNLKWLSGNKVNNYNEKGELIGFRVWLEDVTEKKMYEKLIYELNINFLNFTTDIQTNIEMLIESCGKLLNANTVIYCRKIMHEGKLQYQIISNDKKINTCDSEEFKKNFFISEFFNENHDFIQTFYNINQTKYAKTDYYINDYKAKGCNGKLIKSQNEFNSAICVFYQQNPILSHQDKLVLFLICDAIEIEQRRWQVQQDLEEQNKLKTELLSRTSHELKTPLISIKGFTELLLTVHNSKLDTDMISMLEQIKEGSNRLEGLITSLLRSSKLDQRQLKLNTTTEDLSFLIKFCIKELQGLAELRNHTINLEIHEYLTANIDKERIYEVLSNILLNAIKYTPPGGVITIKSEVKKKFYIISVEDNGIGITEEEKKHLFKQFGKIERYGKGWDVDIEGSGLGLYISKKIIELHGGRIWIESKGRNEGSIFYFSLPIISD